MWVGCIEGIFYELCEISSSGFSVSVCSVPFIALLPHYPTNILASALYWMGCMLNGGCGARHLRSLPLDCQRDKMGSRMADLMGARVRLASMGTVERCCWTQKGHGNSGRHKRLSLFATPVEAEV